VINSKAWEDDPYGMGWSWDDYNDSYMAEKSPFPVYGNAIRWIQSAGPADFPGEITRNPTFVFSEPDVNWKVRFVEDTTNKTFRINRRREENYFEILQGSESWKEQQVPFITYGVQSALELLKDTLQKEIFSITETVPAADDNRLLTIFSHSKDSLLKSMMHRSDNFFAEQVLIMVSNELMGKMKTSAIIDRMLQSDLKSLPQAPAWVDGSGLSRYNLFSPSDFVWILQRIKEEFGLEKLKAILPGGGEGTLTGYYAQQQGYIFAKTGTLTANVALSGFLITSKNKLLIFSILVNNHRSASSDIRRAIEKFLTGVQKKF
jgi:D-alanyl-D-alanine carboxypeptidase/D-alanyl-D-alanine-endopeptidase (penicillin-binding protein 4)